MKLLNGNKTNLGLIAAGILGVLVSLGYVDEKTGAAVGSVIGMWTGIAIRHAYAKGK